MGGSSAALVHAIRGPILLITLGVLVAVDHFGGYSFGRTWPLLLIVFGLLALIEKTLRITPGPGGTAA
ncbi:MAG TPA: hypothetical protein VKV15_07980 [Bryobacteraceae bacterium]|nr:hypothetical protein [Bryobacteraceae bacterium]